MLAWYDRYRRDLPWRAPPGERPDPYRIWLSEVMLQQTTVRAVAPYYARFLARFGDVQTLAAAPLEDVLKAWAGLGYYARARNLHTCARAVVERHGGEFPASEAALRALPGIGSYTAAAIAAIAFDASATPVDGNVERVIARLCAIEVPLPAAKREIRKRARALTPEQRAGDFAQALMDLGATICTPKNPACATCPWGQACKARARGDVEAFPRRAPKRHGVLRSGAAFVALRVDGFLLVRTRPAKGLLGGMTEVPTSAWLKYFDENEALKSAPRFASPPRPRGTRADSREERVEIRVKRNGERNLARRSARLPAGPANVWREQAVAWHLTAGVARHVFTHFPLRLSVYRAEVSAGTPAPPGTRWILLEDIDSEALPSLVRKVVAHALTARCATPARYLSSLDS